MKRLLCFVLLLCLGLTGCGLAPVVESSMEAPSLPVPVAPDPSQFPMDPDKVPVLIDPELESIYAFSSQEPPDIPTADSSDVVPISEAPEEAFPHVRGPAGTVRARTYLEPQGHDPVYGDVDGDGQTELVYWCFGPTSGLFTVGICVYGLEQGWPILKGSAIFNLRYTDDLGLETDAGQAIFRCTLRKWDDKAGGYKDGKTLRLPVTLADGVLLLDGGALPEEMDLWGDGTVLGAVGSSFSVLREQVGSEALLNCPSCVVWQKTVATDPDGDPAGEGEVWTFAAVTDNGVTVTGTAAYPPPGSGSIIIDLLGEALEPIPPVEDPEALLGLTVVKLTGLLGPYHFDMSVTPGVLIPCWFTEDGKLLIVTVSETGNDIALWDLTAGTPFLGSELTVLRSDEPDSGDEPDNTGDSEDDPNNPDIPDGPDLVTVHQEAIPTRIENEERWEAFLAAAERGVADELTLRLVYDRKDTFDVHLRFDGQVYRLTDGNWDTVCDSLIVDEESDSPPGAAYRRAVHYLISDDPNMTWERYFSRMVSSYAPPGEQFPATCALFSVLE